VNLLDFGFNPSFMRNVTYVFSGAKVLKAKGFEAVEENAEIDYGLLKSLIAAMRFFYSRMAAVLLITLVTFGTWYINAVLKTYTGNHAEVYAAWIILCGINSYSFYTLYYDALLQGRGFIKRSKQIAIAGQSVYLAGAVILIMLDFGLIAIISAQGLSVVIRRILSYRVFYTTKIKERLKDAEKKSLKTVLKAVYPNAVKIGLTGIGGFLVSRSSTIVGSLYLSLENIASYGITIQMISVISGISGVYYSTYYPKLVQYRVQNIKIEIRKIWIKNCLIVFIVYSFFGFGMLMFGDWALNLIGSKTPLLPRFCIAAALVIAFLETNHAVAGGILTLKNEIPFFRAAVLSGGLTLVLLLFFYRVMNTGVWGMILAPGIAQGVYQNWKWPLEVYKELRN
jgi:O-antigen/teichoic acid export membrane protein